ncbi:hypothetical protein AB0B52_22845 [Streptomyces griseofuscus]|uniref:hypothetical protein n=1 Tax=Streptomyces griseofuscus TaxID=146922 RepID=UPI0033F15C50
MDQHAAHRAPVAELLGAAPGGLDPAQMRLDPLGVEAEPQMQAPHRLAQLPHEVVVAVVLGRVDDGREVLPLGAQLPQRPCTVARFGVLRRGEPVVDGAEVPAVRDHPQIRGRREPSYRQTRTESGWVAERGMVEVRGLSGG